MAPTGDFQVQKLSLFQRLKIWLANLIPIDSWLPLGLLSLVLRRSVLQKRNLLPAPDQPPAQPADPVLPYRTPDASGTDAKNLRAGTMGAPFGRNMMPNPSRDPHRDPPVQTIAQRLLARDVFVPAGMQLNVLAAAWIQFMTHDWMRGLQTDEDVTLSRGAGCPMQSFTFKKTAISAAGTTKNERTHWWDTSVVYGQEADAVRRVRTYKGGKVHVGKARGVMPRNPDGSLVAGDNMNSWAGVQILQELFLREHNAVAEFIAREHPVLADDDEGLFNRARLVVAAIAAKIHTVDWTVELLDMNVLRVGMLTNWYGLPRALGIAPKAQPPGLMGLVGKEADDHGVPFSLTEEFVAVYRLHSLLPDGLPLSSGNMGLSDLVGQKGEEFLTTEDRAVEVWDACIKYPCGNLSLFNYPSAMRSVDPTTPGGTPIDAPIDLAAVDLYRDRERGVRNYNDFRRALHMRPFNNYHELTGGNEKAIAALDEVYGKDGIEKLDLQVGLLAEKKIRGFAISETSFVIFLLMASRRLESDRFLNEDFNEETYSRAGFAWVKSVETFRDVIVRHFPEMRRHFRDDKISAFKPTTPWPEEFMRSQL